MVRRDAPGEQQAAQPRRRYGQHFLTDPRILARIAAAAGIEAGDTVLEIGPGRGALTEQLLARVGSAGMLIAVEVDRELAAGLRARHAGRHEFRLVEGDVLDLDVAATVTPPFLLVGNIPYNITTPILFKALEPPRARRMVFLVQREVADRLGAPPGSKEYGALSANAQAVANIEVLFRVSAGSFSPPPKVESAVIRVVPRETPDVTPERQAAYRSLVQGLFSYRRKQMLRAVRAACSLDATTAAAVLERAGIRATDRPEVLTPADFARLLEALRA
ncbi:MAG: 16S rRNA (adenine(1518)-N(6)/adenine(1519)-N(6))-dimethyltransferase RsmA [Gemmatimonadetes bacterium]|nr:16S rRNA (adenine(1518)-N(6)/adenine(1519)-N(6))-dimethyltransferase RsmA [Gemmatimonadota bacterium]